MEQGTERIVEVENLRKWYPYRRGTLFGKQETVKAVDDVSFDLRKGEVLGLVGESGSGKSTVGRTLLRLTAPTAGTIRFNDEDITRLSRAQLRPLRQKMQMIFQDPFSSLNPKMTVERIIAAPLLIQKPEMTRRERRERVERMLETVGLSPRYADRYPHEFSGGQRQRIGIGRALVMEPDFLVADEPVSALDVSIQAQVISLLLGIKRKLGLTILFIAHDLAVVGHISDRIAVMYLGKLVEISPSDAIRAKPLHPYTKVLQSSVPVPDPDIEAQRRPILLKGEIPSPVNPPSACRFHTRCPIAQKICSEVEPPLEMKESGRFAACHFPGQL